MENDKKKLAVVAAIERDGLQRVVSDLRLRMKHYGHKILLKYDLANSPMGEPAARECRGLVLSYPGLQVLSYPLDKFFNVNEQFADTVDWGTAVVHEKLDGTMIHCYFDWEDGRWYAATTGSANGESQVPGDLSITFDTLFWKTLGNRSDLLFKGLTYIFELTTPLNVVVVPQDKPEVTLLSIRALSSLSELPVATCDEIARQMGVARPKTYEFMSLVEVIRSARNELDAKSEGYVVMDAAHRRVKVKSTEYVKAHHAKTGVSSATSLLAAVLAGEQEELVSYFPEISGRVRSILGAIGEKAEDLGRTRTQLIDMAVECYVTLKVFGKRDELYREQKARYRDMAVQVTDSTAALEYALSLTERPGRSPMDWIMSLRASRVGSIIGIKK